MAGAIWSSCSSELSIGLGVAVLSVGPGIGGVRIGNGSGKPEGPISQSPQRVGDMHGMGRFFTPFGPGHLDFQRTLPKDSPPPQEGRYIHLSYDIPIS